MGEDRVAPFGNSQTREFSGKLREARDLDGSDVVVIAVIVAIRADAVSDAADLARNVAEIALEALPLRGDALAGFPGVALAQAGDEQRLALLEAWRRKGGVSSILIGSTRLRLVSARRARTASGVSPKWSRNARVNAS